MSDDTDGAGDVDFHDDSVWLIVIDCGILVVLGYDCDCGCC